MSRARSNEALGLLQHEHFLTQNFAVVFHPCGKPRPASMAFSPQACCCCSASFIHQCHLMPGLPLASRSPVWKQHALRAACYKQTGSLVHRLRIHGNLPFAGLRRGVTPWTLRKVISLMYWYAAKQLPRSPCKCIQLEFSFSNHEYFLSVHKIHPKTCRQGEESKRVLWLER